MSVPMPTRRLLVGLTVVGLLGGCTSSATTAPSALPATPATPSVAIITPVATATPTPSPIDVAATFIKTMANPALSANLDLTGTLTAGKLEIPVSGSMTLHGHDTQSSMTLAMPGGSQTTESINVGADSYTRTAPGPWLWEANKTTDASLTQALAGLLNASDAGVVTKGGRQLHHIVPAGGFSIPPSAFGLTDPAIRNPTVTIDFYADDHGQPAIMAIGVSWTQAAGTQTVPATMALDMAFRDLGSAVRIEAPSDVWTTFTSKRFGYSAAHPADWTVKEAKSDDEFGPAGQALVYVAPETVGAMALASFRDQLVASYNVEFGKPESDTDTTLGGQPARLLVWHATNKAGQQLFLEDVITVRNSTGWELFLVDLAGNESADLAVFNALTATFAFTK